MIDLDLNDPIGEIRALIGDASGEFVSDTTIISALAKFDGDIAKTALLVMSLMLTGLSLLADREREGQIEVYYTKMFERYKQRYDDLKAQFGRKKAVPIYIGGTSLKVKNTVVEDLDNFSLYQMPDWSSIQMGNKTLVEQEVYRYKL